MSLNRAATRRVPNGQTKTPATTSQPRVKKDYSAVEQAIKELYPLEKTNVAPEIDIVLVPGLGANPEDSWKSESTQFNWTTEALTRDFPKSRLLLYKYQSAWTGSLKVRQFMANIAMALLTGLQSVRKKCQRRPIVFIGHSMGGLVIAKAITIADQRRDKFPIMFEAIAASIFFGTPFNGAPVASVAAMYAYAAEKIGKATSSKLLDLLKPGDEGLRELKHEFMRLAGKISPKIDLLCFYEEKPTDFSKMAGLPILFGLAKLAIPQEYAEFVSRDSATLPGVDELGIASNHRDLVKFDGPKDERWSQFVRDPLKRVIHAAQLSVKNRLNSVRDIDRSMINKIMDALEGAPVREKRNALRQNLAPSSWITKEQEFVEWLAEEPKDPENEQISLGDCIWVRGPEGRGKTSASMAAIEEVEALIRANEDQGTGQDPVLLGYFFCDSTTNHNTAEDVLKSLIRQLIHQQETLAPYAKLFVKKKGNDAGKSQAQVTVENLWQALQDMLTDEFIGRKVVFVVNNIHALPEDSDSTIKLMKFINTELKYLNSESGKRTADIKRVPTRWFITSREAYNIETALRTEGVRLVDLKDDKYGDQVQMALRRHAKEKVAALEQQKNYNKALAYFASSLIGRRAQNTQWIDITCVQLQELPRSDSDLPVRRALETMPQDLRTLLNNSWLQVLKLNEQHAETIKEMLRTLVLTYEDPTETELGVLAGLCSNEQERAELHGLVESCKPLLAVKRNGTISFINTVVKTHLLENAKTILGLSDEEIKWQHGVIALRAFAHLKERLDFDPAPESTPPADGEGPAQTVGPETEDGARAAQNPEDSEDDEDENEGGETDEGEEQDEEEEDGEEDESEVEEEEDDEVEYDDEDEDDDESSGDETNAEPIALPYAVKHWLRHASKATLEIAEDLSLEEEFWKSDSRIRRNWLNEYCNMTTTLDGFDRTTLSGLHVAAALGFRQLVAALIRNGYAAEIKIRDSLVNTPLHFAAFFGRPKIVEELLNHHALIDDGDEIEEQTPLHMASFGGHVEVMKKLVLRGANPNATSNDIGPVVNAAICSGNRAAVELLVDCGVSLTVDREGIDAPLALSALLSDYSMFEILVEKYADKLPAVEYSKALVKAAEAGRLEVFKKLLEFQHSKQYFQGALDAAVDEWNWDIVSLLLKHCPGLDCNELFYTIATCTEPQDKMLEEAWAYANGSISPEMLNKSLFDATDLEKESTVQLLLGKCHANPNATGEEYGNALTAAAFDGTLNIVRLLLDAGADVNASDGYALQTAAAEGHYEVVQELLQRGADVNALTTRDNFTSGTALQAACESGQTEIVRMLLESGADPNHGAGEDSPPIIAAVRRAEEEILELLVHRKPKLDVFGGWDKSSPLINAAAYMPASSLKILLDAGADINLQDNDGDTALIVASSRGDVEAVEFLLQNGADIMHSSSRNENALQVALREDNTDCLKVLIDHVSDLFDVLKKAMDSGEPVVTSVVRSAAGNKQGLDYGDEPKPTNTPKEDTQPEDSVKIDHGTSTSHADTQPAVAIDEHHESTSDDTKTNDFRGMSEQQEVAELEQPSSHFAPETELSVPSVAQLNDEELPEQNSQKIVPNDIEYQHDNLGVYTSYTGEELLARSPGADTFGGIISDFTQTSDNTPVSMTGTEDDVEVSSNAATAVTFGDAATEVNEESIREETDEQEEHSGVPDEIDQLSDELRQCVQQHSPRHNGFREASPPREHSSGVPQTESTEQQPVRWELQDKSLEEKDWKQPAEEPTSVEISRKDLLSSQTAPFGSFEKAVPQISQKPSPKTVDASIDPRYQKLSSYDRATLAQTTPSRQQTVEYPKQTPQNDQPTVWQQSQRSSPASAYGHFQTNQPSGTQAVSKAQYHPSPSYDGSHYGAINAQSSTHQKQYYAYQPPFSPDHIQGFHHNQATQAYHDQYSNYYDSLNRVQQQKEQEQLSRQQTTNVHYVPDWEDDRPPPLKSQRSSFFAGGVKNTFDKAKTMGNGFLSRK
ncbi:hypothetical protein F5Y16DRAFT_218338 [Xylariaceae sp. FL0255]|nr:hypothetical protein F5Y16DRAFT_218338 [Xylariaceae sp. FL0255]